MQKTAMLIAVLTVTVAIDCAAASKAPTHDRLIAALIKVESNGNDHAIGDRHMNNKAYGCLQIRQPCVDDVNQRFGTKIRADSLIGNRSLSVWVCQRYLERYGTRAQIGREPSDEDLARIWNGGPNGWKKQSTSAYWTKVQKALAEQQQVASR
jgi:hypothetical protein